MHADLTIYCVLFTFSYRATLNFSTCVQKKKRVFVLMENIACESKSLINQCTVPP